MSGQPNSNLLEAGTSTDSGMRSTPKRSKKDRKVKYSRQGVIHALYGAVGHFRSWALEVITEKDQAEDAYRRLFRLYRSALKALRLLEIERDDLIREQKTLPPLVESALQSPDENIILWSQFFHTNPSPTKNRGYKTDPSPTTDRIGNIFHSIGSFIALTSEAVNNNKRKPENIENIQILLDAAKANIDELVTIRVKIGDTIKPLIDELNKKS